MNLSRRLLFLIGALGCFVPPNCALASDPTPVSVTLAWDGVPGSDIAGYNLYYGTASGNYTNFVPATTTQVLVTGLTPGTRYFFAATAVNLAGLESAFSSEISAVVGTPAPPPNSSLTLAWDAVPGTDIVGYNLYYGVACRTYTNFLSATTTQTAMTELTPGVRYFFAVTAVNGAGLESLPSEEISVVVGAPSSPAQLSLSLSPSAQLNLTCTAPPGYQYEVLATPDLRTWTPIGTVTADAAGKIQFTDPVPPTNTCRLFQLRQVAP